MSSGPVAPNPKSEDPMDLGPFMQEYVLRNPFNPLAIPDVPGPPAKKLLPSQPVKVIIPKAEQQISPCISRSPSVSPAPTAIKPEKSPSPVPPGEKTIDCEAESNAGSQNASPTLSDTEEGDTFLVREDTSGKVIDTPKAHIGSNASYAHQLREMKLPPKHNKIKKWLLQRYKYVSSHGGWISSDDLLKEVKTVFADMKSSILSRIMKFTYPDCRKVINKYGYFYIGLLRRPPGAHFGDPKLIAAVTEVTGHTNTKTLAAVAFEYGVEDNLLAAVIAWQQEGPLSSQAITENMSSTDDDSLSGDTALPGSSEEEWKAPIHVKSSLKKQQSTREAAGQYKHLKWHLRKRPASGPLGYLRSKLRALGRTDIKDQRSLSDSGMTECGSPRGRGSGRRKRRKVTRHSAASDFYNGSIKEENQSENNNDKSLLSNGSSEMHCPSGVNGHQMEPATLGEVYIKHEPADSGYECGSITSQPQGDKQSVPDKTKIAAVTRLLDRSRDSSPPMNSRSHDVDSIADMLKLKRTLESTKQELRLKTEDFSLLEKNLHQAQRDISHLREQLAHRESQFSDLASEFFELSNNFMKLTHRFKGVMTEIHHPSPSSNR